MKFKSKEESQQHHLDNYKTDHVHKIAMDPKLRGYNRIMFLISMTPEGSYLLDVGCNGGGNAMLLQEQKNCYVKGIDIMPELVESAVKRGVFAEVGEAEDLTRFKNNMFDVVVCSEVLEHLFDPMPAIKEAYRVLNEGGLYIVTFPHPQSLRGGEGDFHQTTFNSKDITKMFDMFFDVDVYEIPMSDYFAQTRNLDKSIPQWWGIVAKKKEEDIDVKENN